MSSTNRGTVRNADDFYETPAWVTKAILPFLPSSGVLLDPCCGRGKILKVAREAGYPCIGMELDEERALASRECAFDVATCDSLAGGSASWGVADIILTNPPFCLAEEFVRRSIEEVEKRGITAALLLRLAFLESEGRQAFHRRYLSDVHVLAQRPNFCASVRCKSKTCEWGVLLPIEAERPTACPVCSGKVSVSTSDSCAYAWFVWGPNRGGRWTVLDLVSETERKA